MYEEKYLRNGRAVAVIETLNNGFLVQDIFESSEGDYLDDQVYFVHDLFDSAPTEKQDKMIAELQNKIHDLLASEKEIKRQIEKAKTENEKLLKRFEQFEQLRYLNDFLDGKLTHYVQIEYEPKIIAFSDSSYDREYMKLLTLFGRSNGDLQWRLSYYSDGSGGYTIVIPCLSYEQAVLELQSYVDDHIAAGEAPRSKIIDLAGKYGIKIPDEYIARYKQSKIEQLRKQIAENAGKNAQYFTELSRLGDNISK